MIKNILIGSDPEFLIFNKRTKKCYPSTGFTEGTKEDPQDIGSGFFIQRDNALLEGNIPPAASKSEFIFNMRYIVGYLQNLVETKKVDIIFKDSGEFNISDLDTPDMKLFGCDPYNNVWEKTECKAPDLSDFSHRTCGFHIHIGYDLVDESIKREEFNKFLVKAFDHFVMVPSYAKHFDKKRAMAYGGVGQYRNKKYGVECRSLGGFFCAPSHIPWVWDKVMEAVNFCTIESNLELLRTMTKPVINSTKEAREYMESTVMTSTY